mgnify:CR=1 FL=1
MHKGLSANHNVQSPKGKSVYDVSTKKYVKAAGVKIAINDSILSALKMILGPDAVVFKD